MEIDSDHRFGPAAEDAPTFPMAGVETSDTVGAALNLASREVGPGRLLNTGLLMSALERADTSGRWDRVWLATGRADAGALASLADPDDEPRLVAPAGARWAGMRLSPALAASVALLREMVNDYDMEPVQPGAVALALVSEPTSAVVTTLLEGGELSYSELLDMVQDELLGTRLQDFEAGIAERWRLIGSQPERAVQRATRAAVADRRPADDLDLLRGLVEELSEENQAAVTMIGNVLDEAAPLARKLGTRPLSAVMAEARERCENGEPDEWLLLAAVAEHPGPGCTAVLEVAGLTGPGVAADALVVRDDRAGGRAYTSRVLAALTAANMLLLLVVPALIVVHVLGPGRWWELLLIPLALGGPPFSRLAVPAVMVVVLFFLVTPVSAAVQAGLVVVSWLQARLERRGLLSRVGVGLRPAEYGAYLKRRHASLAQFQIIGAAWRSIFRQARLERRVADQADAVDVPLAA
jgi:hypothetical protein